MFARVSKAHSQSRSQSFPRRLILSVIAVGLICGIKPAKADSELQLHWRIDAAVAAAAIGPLAPRCSDADFVRRIYLELTGVIPTPQQVLAFLTDDADDKRARLVDSLLDSPEFSRHFAVQLSTMLLDRRSDLFVDQPLWESYLIESMVRRKPLDALFAELIYPESLANQPHAARKFLVGSQAEPHSMTRDVGRVVFGMDMQCAQCHDHPLISDYLQEDYYGLFAFFNRTSLFEDKPNKVTTLSEKADGHASFESVFTGDGRSITRPRLPKGESIYSEPQFAADDAYLVKPEKTHPGKPKHSRRQMLAEKLPGNPLFRRNMANRIWMLVMGRGLVHPVDFHHVDNPALDPDLLSLLADELASCDFDLRHFVRQLVLSQTYQRSCEPPAAETLNHADIAARVAVLQSRREQLDEELKGLRALAAAASQAWREAFAANDEVDAKLPKLDEVLAEAEKKFVEATQQRDQASAELKQLVVKSESLQGVSAAAAEALQRFEDEPALQQAQALLKTRVDELAASVTAERSKSEELDKALQAAKQLRDEAATARETLVARRVDTPALVELERAHLEAAAARAAADGRLRMTDGQIELAGMIVDFPKLAQQQPDAAATQWETIVQRWTHRGQVAPLKALTPEQLAASAMQATGMLARSETAAREKVDKTPPEALKQDGLDESEKLALLEVAVQSEWLNQLRGNLNQFVSQFGGRSGEEFQATVNQALFLGNGPINGWVGSAAKTLIGQHPDTNAIDALADELTLAVLSRPATTQEQKQLALLLQSGEENAEVDRPAAIADLVWAMLAGNEFRFNH
jgi:hypothetical protein